MWETVPFFPYKQFPNVPLFGSTEEAKTFLEEIEGSVRNSLSTLFAVGNEILLLRNTGVLNIDYSEELLTTLNTRIDLVKKNTKASQIPQIINEENIKKYLEYGENYKGRYEKTKLLLQEKYPHEDISYLVKLLTITSQNVDISSNITFFKRLIENEGIVEKRHPFSMDQIQRIKNGEEPSGPKIHQYYSAIMGDPNAVTVDTWIARVFGIERKAKRKEKTVTSSLGPLDHLFCWYYIRSQAPTYGLTPAEMTIMLRRGIRIANKQPLKDYDYYL